MVHNRMPTRAILPPYLLAHRHSVLLFAIIALLAVRPLIGDNDLAAVVFSLAIIALLLIALMTIQVSDGKLPPKRRRRRVIVGWVIAVPALVERLWIMISPTHSLFLIGAFSWGIFFGYVTWCLLTNLLRERDVTLDTISMSVSVYLLLGFTWGLLYVVIYSRHPEAFRFGDDPLDVQHVFPVFIYFSLTTLSTIGFGDITPITLQARYAAVAEGITGQFYLAILVARLVGMHMSRSSGSK